VARTIQVLIIIAIVCSAVEICYLLVSYLEPIASSNDTYLQEYESRAALRWKIYWFSGVPLSLLGLFLKKNYELLGYALLITGTYLMVFGNNGGFWAEGYEIPRLITSSITLLGLLYLIKNERWIKNV